MINNAEACVAIKNRIETLNKYYVGVYNALITTNSEHPEYLTQPFTIDRTIEEKLGKVPSDLENLKKYLKNATDIYIRALNMYEGLVDNHKDYVKEKRFLYETSESVQQA